MSTYNLPMGKRDVIITVDRVMKNKNTGGYQMITVVDTEGQLHELAEIDFPSRKWDTIEPGSRIVVTIYEKVGHAEVMDPEE